MYFRIKFTTLHYLNINQFHHLNQLSFVNKLISLFRHFSGILSWLIIIHGFINVVCSTYIDCKFRNDDFHLLSFQYTCTVENNLNITHKCTEIKSIKGPHEGSKNNDDVTGITIHDKKVQYMPTNLGEKFKNLTALRIRYGRLQEINKWDLQQFTKLQYLNLDQNDIEILEEGLFEFNSELILIWFDSNKIKNIGDTTFKNLNKLTDLDLNSNKCFSKRFEGFRPENLTQIKVACYNSSARILDDNSNVECQLVNKDKKLKLLESQLEEERSKNQRMQKLIKSSEIEFKKSQAEFLQNATIIERISKEKIYKLQNELDKNKKLQKELQDKLSNTTEIKTRFNDVETEDKSPTETILSRHIWMFAIAFSLNIVLLIINVSFVLKLQ